MQFINQITRTRDIIQLEAMLDRVLAQKNIRSHAFTYYSQFPSSLRKLRYERASEPLSVWHKHYLASGYEDVDQTLQSTLQVVTPIHWDVQKQLTLARTSREKRIREESIAFGIDKGLSIPIHGANNDFAVLVLHQRKEETCLYDYQKSMGELIAIAQYYYQAIKNALTLSESYPEGKFNLTQRELQCLHLTAENYLAREIAKKISISERTVHFHLQNANKKLGVKNKFQAVMKAFEK